MVSKNQFIISALVNPKLIETSHKEMILLSNEEAFNTFKLAPIISNDAVKIVIDTHNSIFLSDFTLI
jgi:acyl CoA:acetate/3-ketoacid CoA transferase alpha subunit